LFEGVLETLDIRIVMSKPLSFTHSKDRTKHMPIDEMIRSRRRTKIEIRDNNTSV